MVRRRVGADAPPSKKADKANPTGHLSRDIDPNYEYDPKNLEPLVRCLRSALMALGHATSAHHAFVKLKSRDVSPDGMLGGQGFVQHVAEMRQQFAACVEALSGLTDTLYDEIKAPHWSEEAEEEAGEELEEVEELREDPEGWAQQEEQEGLGEHYEDESEEDQSGEDQGYPGDLEFPEDQEDFDDR